MKSAAKFYGKAGDRVRLVHMPNDPDPILPDTEGTVVDATEITFGDESYTQVIVNWDNGRRLSCVCPPDFLQIIPVRQ